jgi:hypothetical protein
MAQGYWLYYENSPPSTKTANIEQTWKAAQDICRDYPELLEAARQTIFGE